MKNLSQVIRLKAERIAEGRRPRVLDLFAGCGGLSLGFHRAGFMIAAGIEIDPFAAASYGCNFHPGEPLHIWERESRKQ